MINHQLKCTVKGLKRSSIKIEFISEVCVKKCVCQDPEVHSEIGFQNFEAKKRAVNQLL